MEFVGVFQIRTTDSMSVSEIAFPSKSWTICYSAREELRRPKILRQIPTTKVVGVPAPISLCVSLTVGTVTCCVVAKKAPVLHLLLEMGTQRGARLNALSLACLLEKPAS